MQNASSQSSQMSFNLSQANSSRTEMSAQQLEKMLSLVMTAADSMNRPKLKNLALIRESPRFDGNFYFLLFGNCCDWPLSISRYVDRVAASLQQHLKFADKMETSRLAATERRRAAAGEHARLQPVLKRLIERTKELQAHLEQNISSKYNNRPVHITGGVATL